MNIQSAHIHMAIAASVGVAVGTSVFASRLASAPQNEPPRNHLMESALPSLLGGAAVAGVGALMSKYSSGAGRMTMAAGLGAMAIPSLIMFPFLNEPSLR